YDPVGNRLQTTDARGHTTKYVYDARELLQTVQQTPTLGADPATDSARVWTSYTYDHAGGMQHAERAPASGVAERAFDYYRDGAGRLRQEVQYPNWPSLTSPLVTSYAYHANGNQSGVTKPKGDPSTYSYDVLNRRTGITYSDGMTPNVAYTYDAH